MNFVSIIIGIGTISNKWGGYFYKLEKVTKDPPKHIYLIKTSFVAHGLKENNVLTIKQTKRMEIQVARKIIKFEEEAH